MDGYWKKGIRKTCLQQIRCSSSLLVQGRTKHSTILILKLLFKYKQFLDFKIYTCLQISRGLSASSEGVSSVREEHKSEFGLTQAFCFWCSNYLSQACLWAQNREMYRLMERLTSDSSLLPVHVKFWEFYTVFELWPKLSWLYAFQ